MKAHYYVEAFKPETATDTDLSDLKVNCAEVANWHNPRSKLTSDEVARLQRIALQTVPKLVDEIKRLRAVIDNA